MRIETNEKLVQRNRKIAQILFFFSLIMLGLGFLATNSQFFIQDAEEGIQILLGVVLPAIILPIAFASTLFSVRMTNLWVRLPRPEIALPENLKGMDKKSVLYNYYHFPARHVLICPQGVFAIVTRFQDGKHSVQGDRWRSQRSIFARVFGIFRMNGIGNPTGDAIFAAQGVQKALNTIAPEVQVQPVVIFTDPRVRLTISNPTVPVVHLKTSMQPSFRDYLKSLPKQNMLTPDQTTAFEVATGVQQRR